MNMGKVLERTAARFPDRTAIVDPDTAVRYTYEDWNKRVAGLAASLDDHGVQPGDRVGAILRTRVETATLYWATQRVGATFVPYNTRSAADELSFLVNNSRPKLLFFSAIGEDAVTEARSTFEETDTFVYVDDETPASALAYDEFLDASTTSYPSYENDPDDVSIILHTSGTTGMPKGVPRTHTNTYAATTAHIIQTEMADNETTLGLMPVYHTMGLRILTASAMLGGKWVAQRSFDAEQTLSLIEDEQITSLYLVPTVYHGLIESNQLEHTDLSHTNKLAYAGTPMTEPVQQEVLDRFEPDVFVNHFGSTEVYTYSVCPWIAEKPGCAGRAGINTEVRVVEPDRSGTVSPNRTVEQGETGEVIVDATSPEAFSGYLNRPDADAESFEDGWYFTGDLGYFDEDGDLFVTGRVDDMIISGGENIYPIEVEDVLEAHDAVSESAVVGLEHERWNQVVTSFVKLADIDETTHDYEALAEALDAFAVDSPNLANYKRPRKYIFVGEIPKSTVGKTLKSKLRAEDIEDVTDDIYADIDL